MPSVRWMSVEFDARCGTVQHDDSLQLYIPPSTNASAAAAAAAGDAGAEAGGDETASTAWCPVLSRFSGAEGWPTSAVILPGDCTSTSQLCLSVWALALQCN